MNKILDWFRAPVPYRGPGHRPLAKPGITPRPPAPPVPGGQLPVEAQILLRVMGEDLQAARDLLRDMPPLDRAILLFYIEQIAGLVYEAEAQDGRL